MVTRGEMMLMGKNTVTIRLRLHIKAIEKEIKLLYPFCFFLTWKKEKIYGKALARKKGKIYGKALARKYHNINYIIFSGLVGVSRR